LIDSSRNEKTPSSRTIQYLSDLNYYRTFSPDESAYENFKQEGFEIISNQTIKINIVQYYLQMDKLKSFMEWQRDNHFNEFKTYKLEQFAVYTFGVEAIPEDFDKLKANKIFWRLLSESKRVYGLTSGQAKEKREFGIRFLEQLQQTKDNY
ncbi:MAG TPA: hypothetical protein VG737_14820, partial [Cyclobacteriaceae bacterium]|nr:hypothetical protein [Cyclobacteriaceae bacterium]